VLVDVCKVERMRCFAKERASSSWVQKEQDSEGLRSAIAPSGVHFVVRGGVEVRMAAHTDKCRLVRA
jgi:hypothetical protein